MRKWLNLGGSELVGTFVMVFGGCLGATICFGTPFGQNVLPNDWARLVPTALSFALSATAVIYSPVGRISGAHLNPAVTLAFLLDGKLGAGMALLFAVAQLLGSLMAVGLLFLWWGDAFSGIGFGMTMPGEGVAIAAAFASEAVCTALLIAVIFYFLHHPPLMKFTGWAVGVFIAISATLTGTISGASFNPARSLGPAMAAGEFADQWIYVVAPLLGAAVSAGLSKIGPFLKRPLGAKLHHLAEEYLAHHARFRAQADRAGS